MFHRKGYLTLSSLWTASSTTPIFFELSEININKILLSIISLFFIKVFGSLEPLRTKVFSKSDSWFLKKKHYFKRFFMHREYTAVQSAIFKFIRIAQTS